MMRNNQKSVLRFLFILFIYFNFLSVDAIKLPSVDALKASVLNPINAKGKLSESVLIPSVPDLRNVSDKIKEKVPNPFALLDELSGPITVPEIDLKDLSNLVATTAVFKRNNESLNCFGLPIASFANAIEKWFTQSTKAKDVKFYFSSRKKPDYSVFQLNNFSVKATDFDLTRPTVVLSHGFMSAGRVDWLEDLKNAFLKLANANVIVIDWQQGSNTWNYYSAAISTRIVGLQIAKLFAIIRDTAVTYKDIPDMSQWGPLYFVGHSLGSHIVAHAAYLIAKSQESQRQKWIVSRITGLDPAQPCFKEVDLKLKLNKEDAPFVDIIHTNARFCFSLGLGLPEELGYIDFYPNGGEIQPGCLDIDTSIWNFLILPVNIIREAICSHGRSYQFLTESLLNYAANNCSFIGYKWDRSTKYVKKVMEEQCSKEMCAEMGVNSLAYHPEATGPYFVPTRDTTPYCGAQENERGAFEVHSSQNILKRIAKTISS